MLEIKDSATCLIFVALFESRLMVQSIGEFSEIITPFQLVVAKVFEEKDQEGGMTVQKGSVVR